MYSTMLPWSCWCDPCTAFPSLFPHLCANRHPRQFCSHKMCLILISTIRLVLHVLAFVVQQFRKKTNQVSIQAPFSLICKLTGCSWSRRLQPKPTLDFLSKEMTSRVARRHLLTAYAEEDERLDEREKLRCELDGLSTRRVPRHRCRKNLSSGRDLLSPQCDAPPSKSWKINTTTATYLEPKKITADLPSQSNPGNRTFSPTEYINEEKKTPSTTKYLVTVVNNPVLVITPPEEDEIRKGGPNESNQRATLVIVIIVARQLADAVWIKRERCWNVHVAPNKHCPRITTDPSCKLVSKLSSLDTTISKARERHNKKEDVFRNASSAAMNKAKTDYYQH